LPRSKLLETPVLQRRLCKLLAKEHIMKKFLERIGNKLDRHYKEDLEFAQCYIGYDQIIQARLAMYEIPFANLDPDRAVNQDDIMGGPATMYLLFAFVRLYVKLRTDKERRDLLSDCRQITSDMKARAEDLIAQTPGSKEAYRRKRADVRSTTSRWNASRAAIQ
jgi:hypothetical protein